MSQSPATAVEPYELILVGQQGPVFVAGRDDDEEQLRQLAEEHNSKLAGVPWLRYEVHRCHAVTDSQPVFSE